LSLCHIAAKKQCHYILCSNLTEKELLEEVMNKSELIEALAERKNLSFKKSEEIINTIFDSMADALRGGERIEIRGFGSFVIKDYKPYVGRNPKTGEAIKVRPKKLPFFKVGKELKEMVDN
jgi:integration host factor subunit beta